MTTQPTAHSRARGRRIEVRIPAGSEFLLGTGEDCHVRLSPGADEAHCILSATQHGCFVEDLGTRIGTWVRGHSVRQAFIEPGVPFVAGHDHVVVLPDDA